MKINNIQNNNQTFSSWSDSASKQIQLALRSLSDAKTVNTCNRKISRLEDASRYHYLVLDSDHYGAIGRNPYAHTLLKKTPKAKTALPKILATIDEFISQDNRVVDKFMKYKETISPIILYHKQNGYVHGWNGNVEMLQDRIIEDIGFKRLGSSYARRTRKMLNKLNRQLNQHNLILSFEQDSKGRIKFELSQTYSHTEPMFEAKTQGFCLFPFGNKSFMPQNTIDCLRKINKFLNKEYSKSRMLED